MKSLILQFYRILNSMAHRLAEAVERNRDAEDASIFPIRAERGRAVKAIVLNAFVVTFGVCLSAPLQRVFEDIFDASYRSKFEITTNSITTPAIFDLYYDVDRLSWEVIQEKLDYKLKLAYYPRMSALLVPSTSISLSYFIID